MATSTQPLRLLGSRMPSPIRTGSTYYSSGDPTYLRAPFNQDDCQALDAPYNVAAGSVRVLDWITSDTAGEHVGITVQSAGRRG
jgi:hypothetical protein